ncbi:MAG: hypothetical protein CM15mV105_060 [uncultured marine virus]|nr:MAG: hypothetical protein CM15mV105_060 [uncultured marine virus]
MANLTVTLTESVTLNGSVRGSTNQLTITGIEHVMERIVTYLQVQTLQYFKQYSSYQIVQ